MKNQHRTRLPAAERRETILRAATEVFARSGYRGAKVSDVAARTGVTEPVIFQNFGSKSALFAAVLERAAAEIRASLDHLADGPGLASGLLAHVLSQSTHGEPGQAAPDPHPAHAGDAYGVLFADAAALAAEPDLAGPARDAFRAVAAHLADLIRHAQDAGDISPDADPRAAAWLLLSVLSARHLRAAAMPASLEPAIADLTLRAVGLVLLQDLDRVAGAEHGARGRGVGDEVDAEPDLAVPAAVAGQGEEGLVALGGRIRVDRGEHAAVAALGVPEGDRADAQPPPAVLGPGRSTGHHDAGTETPHRDRPLGRPGAHGDPAVHRLE
jgi:AcrR family transcriptional regulator